jgi:hypothetical protein
MFPADHNNNSKLWVDAGRALLDRLLTSASYSLVSQIQESINSLESYASRDLFALASVCVFSATAVGLKGSGGPQGLKRVCSMLAAHGVTSTIPIPQEQSSKLVLPGIMLYLSSIATINWIILALNSKANDNVMETINAIIDYVVLFAVSRGLARFKASSEMHTLGVISLVFLIFPKHLYYDTPHPTPPKTERKNTLWTDQILLLLESLAIRGVVIWITSSIKQLTGVSGATSIVLLNWAILIWNPFSITSKLAQCQNVLSFMNAEQTADLFQTYLHTTISAICFLVFLFLFIQSRVCPHPVCTACRLGISISMTSWLEILIDNVFKWIERLMVYTIVFIILEYLINEVEKRDKNSLPPPPTENIIITLNNNNENNKSSTQEEQQEEKQNIGIAHAQSTLGLPMVIDSRGNH